MAPGSGVKSEYMKRYREPRWDEYGPCYRELLHYRLGRRLLEQAHAPWLWDDWGPAGASDDSASSASSSGAGGPAPQGAPASPPSEPAAREGPERRARGPAEERGAEAAEAEEARDAEGADEAAAAAALPAPPVKDIEEKPEQEIRTKETEKVPNSTEPRQQPSALFARGNRKAVKSPQRSSSKIKENKHPFALYGWGEKQTDTGSQKTHNVCASAPVREIHESALRAKNRRQVEKRKLVTQRQRAHSVEVEKNRRIKPPPSENPWVTEYMRCYSARA
ncbi:centriole, cilia and spindle-associated protein [Lutra lutra]|uniref:centriole, cilia and spindle-associated protein n=1 Tax=Lutra lutra TaxID=9657 RepID=UPI001FD35BB5|nr:centriole, cilia and spindle-associated protein [Lutra lutra]XP_047558757.1 centriole, cilia and spindle-associated protein [Lutra lutra]